MSDDRKRKVHKALNQLQAIMQKLAVAGYNTPELDPEAKVIARMTHTDLEEVFNELHDGEGDWIP